MTNEKQFSLRSETPSRQAIKERDVARAQAILRGAEASAAEAYALAERLKDQNEFGYARRLYGRIRQDGRYGALSG